MNLLIYALIVAVVTAVTIWVARESGIDAKTNGFASIVIGVIGVVLILTRLM